MPSASRPADSAPLGLRPAPGELPFLLALAAVAIYGCVPETGQMRTIGVMIAGLFMIELVTRLPMAPVVSLTATLIVVWSGLYGATGRGSAIVGAWFAFWPLVLVALFVIVVGPLCLAERLAVGLIGGIAAVGVARTGGIEPTNAPALVAVAVAIPVSILAASAAVALSRRHGSSATGR